MNNTQWKPVLTLPVSEDRDHIRGPANAAITLVEYGDYECPYCAAAHPIVQSIMVRMGDSVRFVYRHFPLTTLHPHAEPAAEAAEAAGAQGKFWQMHDMLFDNHPNLRPKDLMSYAGAIDLDVTRFSQDVGVHAHHDKIREDFMSGVRSGVNGTPTFFVNGMRHDGGTDTLMAALDRSLVFR